KRGLTVTASGEDEAPAPTMMTGTPTNRLAPGAEADGAKPKSASAPPASGEASALGGQDEGAPAAEEIPLVVGLALDEGLDTRLIKTEPDARPEGPPVVMGLPLREPAPATPAPVTASTPATGVATPKNDDVTPNTASAPLDEK